MMDNRQQFFARHSSILMMAENLLLESADGELTLGDLAAHLGIAKGTLYKHFKSKDELYLCLLIAHEHRLYERACIDDGAGAMLARMLLLGLSHPKKTMLYHWLEERLSAHSIGQKPLFDDLYAIRHARLEKVRQVAGRYLRQMGSSMGADNYVVMLWAMEQGLVSLLNSSFYQQYLNEREQKKFMWVKQALDLPKLIPSDTNTLVERAQEQLIEKLYDTQTTHQFYAFGKLPPPAL